MARETFTFEVTVTVDIPEADSAGWDGRDPGDYAEAALFQADLHDSCYVDGFADLVATARITEVD